MSEYIVTEIRDLPNDLKLASKFRLTVEQADVFIGSILSVAEYCESVKELYRHPYDADDSHYVNLAVTNDASLIVSRDRHLLNLMDLKRKDGQEFHSQFPTLRVLEPVALLREIG